MKILLIGSSGYIGSALLPVLELEGHEVATCDRFVGERGSPVWLTDYRHFNKRVLAEFEAVILLAGHSSVAQCIDDPGGAFHNNLGNFVDLLGKLDGQKLVYASSASVYAVKMINYLATHEGRAFHNMYDLTKAALDDVAAFLRPALCWGLRFGTVCGSSPTMRYDLMLNAMVKTAIEQGFVPMGNPETRRPILAMDDLCAAVLSILRGKVPPGVHNLSSFTTTVGAAAIAVSHRTGVPVKPFAGKPSPYDFDMAGASWMPGPKITMDRLIEQLIAARVVPA